MAAMSFFLIGLAFSEINAKYKIQRLPGACNRSLGFQLLLNFIEKVGTYRGTSIKNML